MKLEAGCSIVFEGPAATPMILMLRPRSGYGQWVQAERYTMDPPASAVEYVDVFGNLCQRLTAPAGRFTIRTAAEVEAADTIDVAPGTPPTPVQDLPDSILQYLLPSRYCPSDRMSELAAEVTVGIVPGYDQVETIRAWINEHIEYRYGTSETSTDAFETAGQRAGVCRDFAHLGISLSRCLTIPARMVVGYLHELDPMDLHAWFEAFIGGRWYTFDATQDQPRGGRIAIAYGRDAADLALVTQFGPARLIDIRSRFLEKTSEGKGKRFTAVVALGEVRHRYPDPG